LWWPIPIIPALGRLREKGCEFEASLGYTASYRSARLYFKTQNKNKKLRHRKVK
jgi:hypothetical protein